MSRPATSYPRRAEDHPWFETAGPIGLAHRGGALHPANAGRENTLAAFRMAAGMGLGYLETDVKLTADGHLVCFHDDTLDRCTDATGRVGARTLEQLREVRVEGAEPIPTLLEALEALPDACFTVDLKDRAAIAPMARLLQRRDLAERVCVAGASDGALGLLAEQTPGLRTALGWRSLTALISASKARTFLPGRVATGQFAHVPIQLGAVSALLQLQLGHGFLGLAAVAHHQEEAKHGGPQSGDERNLKGCGRAGNQHDDAG
mgnify:CR=1 FL=1